MRRALLLATLLAVPALAAAQAQGVITLDHGTARADLMTLNIAECNTANAKVTVRWNPLFLNGNTSAPIGGRYVIYGSDTGQQVVNGVAQCPFQNSTNPTINAGTVLDTQSTATNAEITISQLLTVAAKSPCVDGAVLYICVQGQILSGQPVPATNFAIASGAVTISLTTPPPPSVTDAKPGDRALNVYWDPGAAGTFTGETQEVALMATPANPASGATLMFGGPFSASPARFEGLMNGAGYYIQGQAFTKAANPSVWGPVFLGTPEITFDFWETYRRDGGRETGGCGSGAAGPVGLGILLATLGFVRRRK
jgi:hypothetical protein